MFLLRADDGIAGQHQDEAAEILQVVLLKTSERRLASDARCSHSYHVLVNGAIDCSIQNVGDTHATQPNSRDGRIRRAGDRRPSMPTVICLGHSSNLRRLEFSIDANIGRPTSWRAACE